MTDYTSAKSLIKHVRTSHRNVLHYTYENAIKAVHEASCRDTDDADDSGNDLLHAISRELFHALSLFTAYSKSTLISIPQTDIGHFLTITRRNIPC